MTPFDMKTTLLLGQAEENLITCRRLVEEETGYRRELQNLVDYANNSIQAAEDEILHLTGEKDELIRAIAAGQKETTRFRLSHKEEAEKLQGLFDQKLADFRQELDRLQKQADEQLNVSDRASVDCEATLAAYNAAMEKVRQITEKQAESEELLHEEFARTDKQLKEALKTASIKNSVVRIEEEQSRYALSMTQQLYEEIGTRLEKAEQLLSERQEKLNRLLREKQEENKRIGTEFDQQLELVQLEVTAAEKALNEKNSELNRVRTLAELAQKTLAENQSQCRQMLFGIQEAHREDELTAASMANRSKAAINSATEQKERYNLQLRQMQDQEKIMQATAEKKERMSKTCQEMELHVHDLYTTAKVAAELAADAVLAKENATAEMRIPLTEIANSLESSASDARILYESKAAEKDNLLRLLEEANAQYEKEESLYLEMTTALSQQEQACRESQKSMQVLGKEIEAHKIKRADLLREEQERYDKLLKESARLKEAAVNAEATLRDVRSQAEKAKRRLTLASAKLSDLENQKDQTLREQADRADMQIQEARAMVNIAGEMRERLMESHVQKETEVSQRKQQLHTKEEQSAFTQGEYDRIFEESSSSLEQLRSNLQENLQASRFWLEEAQQQASAASADYNKSLQETYRVSDDLTAIQQKISDKKAEINSLCAEFAEQRASRENAFRFTVEQMEAEDMGLRKALASLEEKLRAAKEQKRSTETELKKTKADLLSMDICLSMYQESCSAAEYRLAAAKAAIEEAPTPAATTEPTEEDRIRQQEAEARCKEAAEASKAAKEREAARIREESLRAEKQAKLDRAKELEEQQLDRMLLGELLSREERLELISSDLMAERILQLKQRIRIDHTTAQDPAKAERAIQFYQRQAERARTMFESAQAAYDSQSLQIENRTSQEAGAKEQLAEEKAAQDLLLTEQEHYLTAIRAAEAAKESAPEQNDILDLALDALKEAKETLLPRLETAETNVRTAEDRLQEIRKDLRRMEAAREETLLVMDEMAVNWLKQEQEAHKALLSISPAQEPDTETESLPQDEAALRSAEK